MVHVFFFGLKRVGYKDIDGDRFLPRVVVLGRAEMAGICGIERFWRSEGA